MPVLRKTFLPLFVLLVVFVPATVAQGTYTQIDYPGAITTSCLGINKAGEITGFYIDPMEIYHGFLLSGGTYTTIDYPGAQSTTLYRINDVGQLVGSADNFSFRYERSSGAFTDIVYPGSSNTFANSINNHGTIAGFFTLNGVPSQGFELIGATYRPLPPIGVDNVYIWGITGAGNLVGYSNLLDFSYESGKYHQVKIPGSPQVYGVNRAGTALVGQGFLYQNGRLQSLKFPAGGLTYAYDVNNAGEVVGLFLDSNNNQHCFTWVPPTIPANR